MLISISVSSKTSTCLKDKSILGYLVNKTINNCDDPLVLTSPRFHTNSDVLVTIQPPSSVNLAAFTDEGGCIVIETSELL